MTQDVSIREKVQNFIEESFLNGVGLPRINEHESFLENGVIDSTGVLELIGFLEEAFLIQVLDEEIIPDNLDSIDHIVRFLKRKLASSNG